MQAYMRGNDRQFIGAIFFGRSRGRGDELLEPDTGTTSIITMKAEIRNVIEETPNGCDGFVIGTEFVECGGTQHLLVRNHVYEALLDVRLNVV
jgi:hypothetical protein